MAPLVPHWIQPSHGKIQEVIYSGDNDDAYTTKSISKIFVPPFGLFAKLAFPPCTRAAVPTYATVQMGRDAHLNLNSDLVYINHSCEPSLLFDIPTLSVLAGPRGLRPGDELTFFYPSTEWHMSQAFDCFCGAPSCRGRISGAGNMDPKALEGVWLNGFVREMMWEKEAGITTEDAISIGAKNLVVSIKSEEGPGSLVDVKGQLVPVGSVADEVEEVFVEMVERARLAAQLAEQGLASYHRKKSLLQQSQGEKELGEHEHEKLMDDGEMDSSVNENIIIDGENIGRVGPTSRELSGEMGGDTFSV